MVAIGVQHEGQQQFGRHALGVEPVLPRGRNRRKADEEAKLRLARRETDRHLGRAVVRVGEIVRGATRYGDRLAGSCERG